MQIHNNTLIAECSAYDFKEMLERKKVKSWLKSVSAFANTDGGSLFYGVNDDGVIVGLENPQADADFISEMIKARLDPVPEVQLIPIEHEGHTLLEVKVKAGTLTPYYYYQDGTRTAYVRVGNESVECNSQQLLSLVLKGTHMTWDSLPTQVDASKHSFIILANTFREQGMPFVFYRNKLNFRHRVKSCLYHFTDKISIGLWILQTYNHTSIYILKRICRKGQSLTHCLTIHTTQNTHIKRGGITT
jgi:hypothetical protein